MELSNSTPKTRVYLWRFLKQPKGCTLGCLYVNGKIFFTLEPPWRDNKANVSCIPIGIYNCSYLPKSTSGKYKKVYHVQAVPNRLGILIHSGNLVKHTLGCILIGKKHGKLAGEPAVLNSKSALKEFIQHLNNESFELVILGGKHA